MAVGAILAYQAEALSMSKIDEDDYELAQMDSFDKLSD